MSVQLSLWGILLAALSAMIIGWLWYSPMMFGKTWMKAIGLTNKEMKRRMGVTMVGLILVSLITAYVMSFFMTYTHGYVGGSWVKAGVVTALFAWAGFTATTIFAHGLFEPRDRSVLYINVGNRLITLLAMGLILAAFMS